MAGAAAAALLLVGAASAGSAKSSAVDKSSAKSPTRTATSAPTGPSKTNKTSSTSKKKKSRQASRKRSWRRHGQQAIQTERAREIQEALMREKYLSGEVSGVWDEKTKMAMARYQEENGWQTKVLPDSRALIKLGLGPTHAGVINPESLARPSGLESDAGAGVNRSSSAPSSN